MESTKVYSGKKYGYENREFDFEHELEALCDIAPEAYVAHDLEVDDEGDWTGTMVIRFSSRKIGMDEISGLVDLLNNIIEDDGKCECVCEKCEGASYDVTDKDMAALGEELKKAVEDFGKLVEVFSKKD